VFLIGVLSFLLGGLVFTVAPKVIPKNNCENLRTAMKSEEINLNKLWSIYQSTKQQVISASPDGYPQGLSNSISPRLIPLYESNLSELTNMSNFPECLINPKEISSRIEATKKNIKIVEKFIDINFVLGDPYPKVGTFLSLLKAKD
jgi:hypothetical protein